MAALEPRRLGAAAGVGAATKASDAAFSRANPPGCHMHVSCCNEDPLVTLVRFFLCILCMQEYKSII